MTEDARRKAILEYMEKRTKEVTASKESAREFLIGEGVYTHDGRLTEQYGGPEKKRA